jgi:hypothetical protein
MKACTKCRVVKPFSAYAANKRTKDKRQSWCITCSNEYTKQSRANNPEWQEHRREYMRSDERKKWRSAYNKTDNGRTKRKAAKSRSETPSIKRNNRVFYKLRNSGHCPKWVKPKDVFDFYDLAYRAGEHWVVDHIIPLNGKTVCGLHVPSNLQVIPKFRNEIKSDSFDGAGLVTGILPI